MDDASRTSAGEATTRLVLTLFRTHGLILAAGDRIARRESLTPARWQVLGAIALAGRSLTVAQIARRMGLTRQSVHATVRRLAEQKLVELLPNADHRRSPVVQLTSTGRTAYANIDRRQAKWANELGADITIADLETADRVLSALCLRLENDEPSPTTAPIARRKQR
ncbi:MarR family winged helix-turn-helix transcriptional regulator [Fodinicola acaciae]|uniref:MarR family winged helix-turn-helix transcriptional regulator n=1 Tax=Fodinicola acaciae TaxID=2681555 RepID=UPI0013D877CB|nr:MarR family transcriptional regulator [Fodinicola acaciae]